MKLKFGIISLISIFLVSCINDDYEPTAKDVPVPITFYASIQPESRVTVNNGWVAMYDNRIGISIDGEVKEYVVSETGELTSEAPFYWNEREFVLVQAWFPWNDGVKSDELIVHADQSISENYEKSDYLEVLETKVTAKRPKLVFKHRTAKISASFNAAFAEGRNIRMILHGLTGVNEGSSIKMTFKNKAIVVPQTIPAGTEFVEVILDENERYAYRLEKDFVILASYEYKLDITINEETREVEVIFSEPSDWEAELEIPDGNSPETDTDSGNGSWNGDGEDSDGDSSESDVDNGNGSWNGDGEDSDGNSSESDVDYGNGSWSGDSEDSNGSSNDSDGTGNGSWSGDSEDSNGSSNDSDGTGNGSWSGDSEDSNGSSNDSDGTGNGFWNEDKEDANGSSNDANGSGNGSWNEDKEDANGSSNGANGNGNGSWNGDEENAIEKENKAEGEGSGTWTEESEEVTATETTEEETT